MREARLPRDGIHAPGPSDICRSGKGRAFMIQQRHREKQAARVEPALAALAQARTDHAHGPVARYFGNRAIDGVKWPQHIGRMAVECGAERQP